MEIRTKRIALLIASMGMFVESLDIAIVNLALPSIEKDLQLSPELSNKIQSLYILTYGCLLILGGKLSDFLGKKRTFLAGTTIFLITSLGAGLSHNFEALAFFRAVQGIGAALLMPAAFAIVNYYFTEGHERSRAIGIFGSFAALGSGGGLSAGGIIASYWGWSWIFLINVPLLLVVIIVASFVLDKDEPIVQRKFPDIPSAIALVISILCLTWATELLIAPAMNATRIIGALTVMVAANFYLRRRLTTQPAPLLNLQLFTIPSVRMGNTLFVLLGVLFVGYQFIMSYLLQQNFGYAAATAGLMMMPANILAVLLARLVLPLLSKRWPVRKIALAGALSMILGVSCLIIGVECHSFFTLLTGGFFIAGIGMITCYNSYSVMAMEEVPADQLGVGGSLTTTAYFIGGSIGLPLLSVFMGRVYAGFGSAALLVLLVVAVVSGMVLGRREGEKRRRLFGRAIVVNKTKIPEQIDFSDFDSIKEVVERV